MLTQKRFKKEDKKSKTLTFIEYLLTGIITLVSSAGGSYNFYQDVTESILYSITKFCGQYGFLIVLVSFLILLIIKRINRTTQRDRILFALRKVLVRYREDVFFGCVNSEDPDYELKHRVTVFQWVNEINRKQFKKFNYDKFINGNKLTRKSGWLKAICRSAKHMHIDEISCFLSSSSDPATFQGKVGHIHKTSNTLVLRINVDLKLDSNGSKIKRYSDSTYCTEESVKKLISSGKNIPRSLAGFSLITPDAREYVVILDSVDKNGIPDDYLSNHSMGINAIKFLLEALE